MVSDSKLVDRLWVILGSSDLSTTTAAVVRRRLEEDFGIDLSERKAFITDQIDMFLQIHMGRPENDTDVDAEEEGGEEESETVKEEENGGGQSEEEDPEEEQAEEKEEEEDSSDVKRSKKQRSAQLDKDAKKKVTGFCKPCRLSPQLQELVGVPELARTQVVKKLWAYIREKKLQNPKNKRKILCDETLHSIFRVNSVDMFQMNKALSKHIWPIDEEDETAPVNHLIRKSDKN
ncbi:unnamed protein product [Ilex paraguariensis]|uniref:DM2 domain-containing protein n=1 Tax=Ilex paraguariensis TaxID=185542 RepID=A0ABC8URZ2_9AQUA